MSLKKGVLLNGIIVKLGRVYNELTLKVVVDSDFNKKKLLHRR